MAPRCKGRVPVEMTTEDVTKFLRDLSAAGVQIWASEGNLQFRAPAGVMTSAIRAAICERKREILTVLGGPKFYARGAPSWTPILRYHQNYWKQLQAGEFDIGFINGSRFVVKYNRPLDARSLHDRVAWLASRHSILRARVVENDEVGFLYDQPHESLLKVVDLSHRSDISRDQVRAVADDLVWSSFDASTGPLARIFAVRLSASEHLLGMVVHHFICDGVSLELLSKELIYGPAPQQTPALQYSDYILAMNEWIEGSGVQLRMAYWKAQLRNSPTTRLPPDFKCDPDASAELNVDLFSVPAKVASALNDVARRKQTTLFAVFLAAKMSALSWCLSSPDIVVLVQHHHRDNPLLLSVVGAVTDRLPVRAQISIHLSFEENLRKVQDALKAARTYEIPLGMLDDVLPDIGASGIAPGMNFLSFPAEAGRQLASQEFEPFPVTPPPRHGAGPKHAAHWMNAFCDSSGVHGSVGYSPALYRRETFARFLGIFCGVLEGVAEDPARPVVELCNRRLLSA
jgi:hypothetical protein